ncbi:23S rRNA (pseudouridine(1915)-N(3))-methyltransferase RlmH [Paenibacillus barcinonensis]|uniref:Ribosomal RNA large subunit methyltransferase H n=1 Tax=Paenibacillus barcinonensis TaxID=198119 RepID=A0A2V4VQX0_PAEBA|nr:23S rRNA (pseudouridine(1915)-N(3))-methyltransferase RlmH [Paenibacillus barcinonensis]PYE48783.1 23S rRNA (pseudouridine1915-N3)-methyltransferase [Paenibacillus barcinonensis]QKS57789.1 23S rRNA (pseudouridine(1915)-N(3))-methyltransferase RlmH [Paenibacillus barcinonensis]
MKFKVFAVGDKIEKFYLEAIKEYEKRLSRYCDIKLIHIKKEEQLQSKLRSNSFVIAVSTTEQPISSEDLASKIDNWALTGSSDVSIVIGGNDFPHHDIVTLSQMEMDVGLKTTILFEQVYRAYRIINNHPYHK